MTVISWKYYEGFYSGEKESVTIYKAADKETALLIKEIGFIPRLYSSGLFPGVEETEIEGVTSKAKKYKKIKKETEEKYPNLENNYPVLTPVIGRTIGNYVVANLRGLSDLKRELSNDLASYIILEGKYISTKAFDDKIFLEHLIKFYAKNKNDDKLRKESEKFFKELKYRSQEVFNKIKEHSYIYALLTETIISDEELDNSVNQVALVHSLKEGKVKLLHSPTMSTEGYWNGKTIEITIPNQYNITKLEITVPEDYKVKVVDKGTVTENTIFTEED